MGRDGKRFPWGEGWSLLVEAQEERALPLIRGSTLSPPAVPNQALFGKQQLFGRILAFAQDAMWDVYMGRKKYQDQNSREQKTTVKKTGALLSPPLSSSSRLPSFSSSSSTSPTHLPLDGLDEILEIDLSSSLGRRRLLRRLLLSSSLPSLLLAQTRSFREEFGHRFGLLEAAEERRRGGMSQLRERE